MRPVIPAESNELLTLSQMLAKEEKPCSNSETNETNAVKEPMVRSPANTWYMRTCLHKEREGARDAYMFA